MRFPGLLERFDEPGRQSIFCRRQGREQRKEGFERGWRHIRERRQHGWQHPLGHVVCDGRMVLHRLLRQRQRRWQRRSVERRHGALQQLEHGGLCIARQHDCDAMQGVQRCGPHIPVMGEGGQQGQTLAAQLMYGHARLQRSACHHILYHLHAPRARHGVLETRGDHLQEPRQRCQTRTDRAQSCVECHERCIQGGRMVPWATQDFTQALGAGGRGLWGHVYKKGRADRQGFERRPVVRLTAHLS